MACLKRYCGTYVHDFSKWLTLPWHTLSRNVIWASTRLLYLSALRNEDDVLVETPLKDMPESDTKMLVEVSSLSPRCVCSFICK